MYGIFVLRSYGFHTKEVPVGTGLQESKLPFSFEVCAFNPIITVAMLITS